MMRSVLAGVFALGALVLLTPAPMPFAIVSARQQDTVRVVISSGVPGLSPRLAVPAFIPLTGDAETMEAARVIGEVLWDDLNFEREFYMIPRDTYRTIPQPASLEEVPLARWKELGADGVLVGSVSRSDAGVTVRIRLLNTATGAVAMAREYTGAPRTIQPAESRAYAHAIADEVHLEQRALRGVARTRIAFSSDRDGPRIRGTANSRGIANLYIADYDGARQQRVTISRSMDIAPAWSPDGKAIAFSSWRTRYSDLYILFPFGGTPLQNPTRGSPGNQNYLPAWSPDGTKLAFMSTRDGNAEIYIMNRNGSGLLRLTNHPSDDVSPTWSPTGNQIAFVSDRTGSTQIYVVNVDGSGLQRITYEPRADSPTWSAAPLNEIAFTAGSGRWNAIKVFDFATRKTRVLVDAGNSESPSFSPNGRHVAFVSNRAGRDQIFTIGRDGHGIRQITRTGTNRYPSWSP